MSPVSSDRRAVYAAVVLFIVSLAIRLCGITWTLANDLHNTSLHPDETVVYSNYSYKDNPLIPGNYNYPSLYPLIVRVAGDMVSTYGNIQSEQGVVPAPAATPHDRMMVMRNMFTKYAPHQRAVNLAGRVISAIFGAATAVVVFFLLLRFTTMKGALFGGALAAIAPALVVHSRFQTVDITATFFLWFSVLYAVKLYKCEETGPLMKYALLAGVFAGLSMGTKYTGFVALFSVLLAIIQNKGRHIYDKKWMLLGSAVAACIVVFLITTPGALADNASFMRSLHLEADHVKQGDDVVFLNTPTSLLYQLGNVFTGIGPLAFLIGMFGLVYGAIKKNPYIWIVAPAFLAYFAILEPSQVKFIRYGLPLMPAVAIGFGYAMNGLMARPNLRVAGMIAGVIALLGLDSLALSGFKPSHYLACFDPRFGGLYGTYQYTKDMMAEDPRDSAARYVIAESKKEPGTRVGLFRIPWYWTVSVLPDTMFIYNNPNEQNKIIMAMYFETTKDPAVILSFMQPAPKYIVMTSFETEPFDRITDLSQVPEMWQPVYTELRKNLDDIRANYNIVATFGGDSPAVPDLQYVQPKAWVLQHK